MKVKFITLGCKTNYYESQAMSELFRAAGYSVADKDEAADVYVINTCTVTNVGAQKSRQMIRKCRKENPGAAVAAVGCYVQVAEAEAASVGADILIGTEQKKDIVKLVTAWTRSNPPDVRRDDCLRPLRDIAEYEEIARTETQTRRRANVKIEDGCNNFCAYCIIPYARGRVRSRKLNSIAEEVEALAGNGFSLFVLTGIHIASYGLDLDEDISLIDVIECVSGIAGVKKIQLGSLEPIIVTGGFARRLAKLPNILPQFHLSLQSGCDATLRRMNRRYTAEEYRQAVELLRTHIPGAAVTTDVIVGFPGETDDDFEKSYEFCREIGFKKIHVFKYSKMAGTAAAAMDGQIDERIKNERSKKLIELGGTA